MANKLYPESTVQAIADAIRRVKLYSQLTPRTSYTVSQMPRAISGLTVSTGTSWASLVVRNISGSLTTPTNYVISNIRPYAFALCSKLASFTGAFVTSVGDYAFYSCSALTAVSLPLCSYIGSSAFLSSKLITANFPNCTEVGSYAFYNCGSLQTASFPSCVSINNYTFNYCTRLRFLSFPEVSYVGTSAFQSCWSMTAISLPSCTIIDNNAFRRCTTLSSISVPVLNRVNATAFASCSALSGFSGPLSYIGNNAFSGCYHLLSFYLTGSSVASLNNTNAFTSTPISNYTTSTGGVYGSIYVPASLVDSYKSATNWTVYSARITSIV